MHINCYDLCEEKSVYADGDGRFCLHLSSVICGVSEHINWDDFGSGKNNHMLLLVKSIQ